MLVKDLIEQIGCDTEVDIQVAYNPERWEYFDSFQVDSPVLKKLENLQISELTAIDADTFRFIVKVY